MEKVEHRTSPRTGDAVWMKFECGAGSRWTSTTEDSDGDRCNFSGCGCGTLVRKVGETDDRQENWFGLRVGAVQPLTVKLASNGIEVVAKDYKGEPSAVGYANRTQAQACVDRLGAGEWCIWQGTGRPFYVARASQFKEAA